MSHLMVTVGHPDFEETAVVPATALPRMTGQGWYEIDDNDEQPSASTSKVEDILAEVGDDKDKAAAALEAEVAGKNRPTLVKALEAILAG